MGRDWTESGVGMALQDLRMECYRTERRRRSCPDLFCCMLQCANSATLTMRNPNPTLIMLITGVGLSPPVAGIVTQTASCLVVHSRDESILGIPMGPMGPTGIPWERESEWDWLDGNGTETPHFPISSGAT